MPIWNLTSGAIKVIFTGLRVDVVASLRPPTFFYHLPLLRTSRRALGCSTDSREIPDNVAIADGWHIKPGSALNIDISALLWVEALYHSFEANGSNTPYRLVSAVGTVNFYFGPGPSEKRTEAALAQEKADAEKARQDAEAAKQQALQAQQAAQIRRNHKICRRKRLKRRVQRGKRPPLSSNYLSWRRE